MAQTRSVVRLAPRATTFTFTVALAAVILAILVTVPNLGLGRPAGPTVGGVDFSPAVIESARQWEIQRRQQRGEIDWAARSARSWELQRRQQGDTE